MKLFRQLAIASIAGLAMAALPAAASVNIVGNGDFSQGGADWTFTPAASGSVFQFGNHDAMFGAHGAFDDTISQVLHTTPGQSYRVSFSAAFGNPGAGSDLSGSFGNTTLFNLTNQSPNWYRTFSYVVQATGTSTLLSFSGRNIPDWNYLTNISVTAVPEPSTWAMVGAGLTCLLIASRRRSFNR